MGTLLPDLPLASTDLGILPASDRQRAAVCTRSWSIWVITTLLGMFQFILQLSSGVMVTELRHTFGITALGAGLILSSYYYIYTLLQTPAGFLLDRYSCRAWLALGALVCACGSLLFATATNIWTAELGRLLMGGGNSLAFVGMLCLIGRWFSPKSFARLLGLSETVGMSGVLLGNFLLAYGIHHLGWRHIMLIVAVIATLFSVLSWFIIRDYPDDQQQPNSVATKKNILFRYELMLIIMNPRLWLNGIYAGLLISVVTVFSALWGVPFLEKAYGFNLITSTLICSMVLIGVAVGCPLIGWLDEQGFKPRYILVVCALLSSATISIMIYDNHLSKLMITILMCLLGVFCSGYIINYTYAHKVASSNGRSISIGFTNTLAVLTAPILQPLIGWLLHALSHRSAQGMEIYHLPDYQLALSILPVFLIIAAYIGYRLYDDPIFSR